MRQRERVSIKFTQPSKAQQQFINECDINNIMAKYERSGIIDHVSQYQGKYGDFIGYPDFQNAMFAVSEATTMFNSLPSSIRTQFRNDPEAFLAFAQDPENTLALQEMGLLPPSRLEALPSSVADAPAKPEKSKAKPETPAPAQATDEA